MGEVTIENKIAVDMTEEPESKDQFMSGRLKSPMIKYYTPWLIDSEMKVFVKVKRSTLGGR